MSDLMIRTGLPQPVGRRLGIIAKALLALAKRDNGLFQLFPRGVLRGDIHVRPDEFTDLAIVVEDRMRHGMYALDGSIRHQQSVFMLEILAVARGLIDGLLHGSAIFRMGALDNELQGRLRPLVALEDTKGFLRPNEIASGDTPAEAAGSAQFLCLGEI